MDRRRFLLSVAGVVAAPLAGGAQQARVYRIGYLAYLGRWEDPFLGDAFRQRRWRSRTRRGSGDGAGADAVAAVQALQK